MDPLSALAIVAAVVQFADLGGRLLSKGWKKSLRGQGQEALLAEQSKQLSSLMTALHEALDDLDATSASVPRRSLEVICKECDSLAAELQQLLVPGHAVPSRSPPSSSDFKSMQARLELLKGPVKEAVLLCIW